MSSLYLEDIFYDVSHEANAARNKFGTQTNLNNLEWLSILAEEFGEAAMLVTQLHVPPVETDWWVQRQKLAELEKEVQQTAAVAMRWLVRIRQERKELEPKHNHSSPEA